MNLQLLTKSNLHTHTCFADGKHTAEEVVLSAIENGMDVLGFSEHSFHPHPDVYSMETPEIQAQYRREIERLKLVYTDHIKILCGIEQDSFCGVPTDLFDYVIGSVHYLYLGGEYCEVDLSAEATLDAIKKHCGGDPIAYAKAYFEAVARVEQDTQCDIIGHFDLITKFDEQANIFDTTDPRYLKAGLEALDALLEKDVIFEVNTGAIARGYRKTPYPMKNILVELNKRGFGAIIASDCHDARYLDLHFDECAELLAECGFKEKYIFTKNGFHAVSLR